MLRAMSVPPQATSPVVGAISYTCPMHPEIERQAPGTCPICGMDLVETPPERSERGPVAH